MAKKPEEISPHNATSPPSTRRNLFFISSACFLLLLLLSSLTLSFTLLKLQNPHLSLNSIRLHRLHRLSLQPLSFNATLSADLSISNPNSASFRFRNSTTLFFYASDLIAVAYAPPAEVRPRRTLRINVSVEVMMDRLLAETNASGVALRDGALNLTSFTDVSGRVDLLGVYKRGLDVLLNCSFTLGVFDSSFVNRVCEGNVV